MNRLSRLLRDGVVRSSIAAGLIVLLVSFLLPRSYTAEGSFLPDPAESTPLPPALAGIAAQLRLGGFGGGRGPQFYADLVTTRSVLDQVIVTSLPCSRCDSTTTLLRWYKVDDEPRAQALSAARARIRDDLYVRSNTTTGVVTVRFSAGDPRLAAAVVNRLIEVVNEFNLVTYRSRAKARREFTERRVDEVAGQLRAAEEELAAFNRRNRVITASPELQLQSERLQRAVRILEQTYIGLRQSLEEARVEEVRDTPVLTVIDLAVEPVRRSFPRPFLFGVLAAVVVGVIGFGRRVASVRIAPNASAKPDNQPDRENQ